MKRPKPTRPSDVPKGTIEFGGPIKWFSIALIVRTEALSPERISELLGCAPSSAQRKGEPIFRPDGSIKRVPKFSSWALELSPDETDEWDICEAAKLLLARLKSDLKAWQEVSSVGHIRLSCGLSMNAPNRGFSVDPELMRYLGDRSIQADFDIYADSESNEQHL